MYYELNEDHHILDEDEGDFLNDVLNDGEGECFLTEGDCEGEGVVLVDGDVMLYLKVKVIL